jgi:hypothetical protein
VTFPTTSPVAASKDVSVNAKFNEPLLNVDPELTEVKAKVMGLALVMVPPPKDPLIVTPLKLPLTAAL